MPLLLSSRRFAAASLSALLTLPAIRAGTTVADFEDIPTSGPETLIADLTGNSFVSRGIIFTSVTGTDAWRIYGAGSPFDTGHKAADPVVIGNGGAVTFRRRGNHPFDLLSMRVSARVEGSAPIIRITGFKSGGGTISSIQTASSTLAGGVLTLPSTFVQLTSVQITRESPYHRYQLDDVTLVEYPVLRLKGGGVYNEAHGTVTLAVEVEQPSATAMALTYQLGGTATAGSDYTAPGGTTTGTLTIPANGTSGTLTFPITNDTTPESAETLVVSFTGGLPAGAVFAGGASATITIGDNDGVTNFPNWMAAHGLTSTAAAADADPNGDGIPNIECWLFRLNPAGPNLPAWLARRATMTGGDSDPALTLVIPNPLPPDVRIIFSESTDLATWSEQTRRTGFDTGSLWTGSGAARVVESNSLSARTLTLRASVPGAPRPKLFLKNAYEYVASGGSS